MSDRSNKLRNFFAKVLAGKQDVMAVSNAKLFLEAICDQPDPATCIQLLVGSSHGFPFLQSAVRVDTSSTFLNGPFATLLRYLQAPDLKSLCGGDILRRLILILVDPPLVWDAFVEAFKSNKVTEEGADGFSWLLLQLVSLPIEKSIAYHVVGREAKVLDRLLASSQLDVRTRAHRIRHIVSTVKSAKDLEVGGPGGRHDNDFADIHNIAILPTPDELASKDPFLRRAPDVYENEARACDLSLHTDNQFRLLREDMLRDLREEITIALTSKKGRRRGLCIEHLTLEGVLCDGRQPWSVLLRCMQDLPHLQGKNVAARKKFIKDNPRLLKNQSVACLMADQDVVALMTVLRDEDLLAHIPPVICLQISEAATENTLLRIKTAKNIKLVQLSTAVFAYEPVLKQLKEIKELSLENDILHWEKSKDLPPPSFTLDTIMLDIIAAVEDDPTRDLQHVLRLPHSTRLDRSQASCFIAGLRQRLSLVQGPPGTGKSFIGSLVAKAIYLYSKEIILTVCYTHHALDQFLEDLLDLGIPASAIVRLGSPSKATSRTQPLSLKELRSSVKLTHIQWEMMNIKKQDLKEEEQKLYSVFNAYQEADATKFEILEHLEFQFDGPPFFDAFQIPEEEGNMVRVGKKGKAVDTFYLLDRWYRGKDAGIYQRAVGSAFKEVWGMKSEDRIKAIRSWKTDILKERVTRVHEAGMAYNESLDQIDAIHMEKDLQVIRKRRIIGCTTTAAAKYVQALQSISPGILLVEEAGEILESHILTALGPETKQLLLIGDHKQLRPKVHYDLSVEKGDGYDLNRSLFERLVLRGYPHQILSQQHRMRPEISALVRQLTYPDLVDASSTQGRPDLRGFQDNLIFVNHKEVEIEMHDVQDLRDGTSNSSKKNIFEARMTLKCVRYLGQQGYRTDNIVVLTPYLGQLRLLLDELGKDNDPVLNDLDSYDLVRAGLMPAASADLKKPRIRISTIDNYQGEESDIVIISLTRSNVRGDIGFMTSPERLNVLLSRARDALIMIGNAETFMNSRKGKDLWGRFMALLKGGRRIYDGFPVKCERHPDRRIVLRQPEDFDEHCPDGGCSEPCGTLLSCQIHQCPQHCHQLHDHSKMHCEHVMESKCAKGHVQKWKCHLNRPAACRACQREDEKRQKEQQAELERQARREQEQTLHAARMAELDRQIRLLREQVADRNAAEENARALEQKKKDLEAARHLAVQNTILSVSKTPGTGAAPNTSPASPSRATLKGQPELEKDTSVEGDKNKIELPKLACEEEWDRQKRVDGASNTAIDALMALTGLEDVKTKILDIKAKIDTVIRQGTNMKDERLGVVLLGNPGTGKTTVARLYARFLVSIGVLPGNEFLETTGSRLASEGVPGAKKHIDAILKAGGGTFFLDEAYQLAAGHNSGGAAVLDFLLAEIENQVGKIVFILAGYTKEMEKFFEHNPGFDSRMPHRLQFADYNDKELLAMLRRLLEKKYHGRVKIEDGMAGLYARIAIRRLGRGRGREGYGNARALENMWARISERQASRLQRERAAGAKPDDFLFTKADLIGPEPSGAVRDSAAWKELQGLIGLKAVKASIKGLVDRLQLNYQRELQEEPPIEVSLNRIFLGSPGTGKTSVGKLYGAILADMGLLSKREVVIKNPADFVGSVLGESEKNTKAILKASEGKVLIIDEAYMLYSGTKGTGNTSDPYKTGVIDTIVAEVQSTPGEDRCVLLLGYKEQMEEMLENSNPGLARRFQLSYAFHFEDFDDQQLREILNLKLRKQGLDATEEAKNVAIELLSRARDRPNFGNAGEVENLISHAKAQEQKRRSAENPESHSAKVLFLPQDFDENFDRVKDAALNCRNLFSDVVGCEDVINKLEGYQRIVSNMRARGMDPRTQIPFNFIFKGPPGTGKTTTAQRMGKVFYDMGILSSSEYVECSASDLIAPYVGQTGPKTVSVLQRGLGKVLFVDEAYRLGEGQFAKEAIDELVDSLTKPQFFGKLVVILAGYSDNMNKLLQVNPGLSSRFPEEIIFQNMSPEECLTLLQRQIKAGGVELHLEDSQSESYKEVITMFNKLSRLSSWGNGRDVKTLSKAIVGAAFAGAEPTLATLTVSSRELIAALEKMYAEQRARCECDKKLTIGNLFSNSNIPNILDLPTESISPIPIVTSTQTAKKFAEPTPTAAEESPELQQPKMAATEEDRRDLRDPGVSDETWAQLQANVAANELAEKQAQKAIAELEQRVVAAVNEQEDRAEKESEAEQVARLRPPPAGDDGEDDEQKRRHEEARLRALKARLAVREAEEKLRIAKVEEERKKKLEAQAQVKLREMGVCPVGYRWINVGSGYKCAGGSHFVSNAALEG